VGTEEYGTRHPNVDRELFPRSGGSLCVRAICHMSLPLEIPTPGLKIVEDFTKLGYAVLYPDGIHHLILLKQLAFAKSCPINRTDDLNSYAVL
jgi:hypothetical protein